MKPIALFLPAAIFMFLNSCHTPAEKDKDTYSYELGLVAPYDTVNVKINGLKQGIWIETIKVKKDTLYYRNDTLISMK